MPNGRTGGFVLMRSEFAQLLSRLERDTVLGRTLERTVTASELREVLDQWKEEKVKVEEHGHGWYILHFQDWVTVNEGSPLFEGLRRYHVEWLKQWARKDHIEPAPDRTAVEQADVADERPRSGPTGHGGGALRVRLPAPGARSSGVFGGGGAEMVAFPELHRHSTLEVFPVVVFSGIVGGVLLPYSVLLGAVAFLPFALWLLYSAWLGVSNARLRHRWSRQFPGRLSCRQLRTALAADPGRFVMHVRFFGGFDVNTLCPAAVLEDRTTGKLAAVYPPSWRVTKLCEQFQVQLLTE